MGAALDVVKDQRLANIVPMSGVSVVHTVTHLLGSLLDTVDAKDVYLDRVEKLLVFSIMSAFRSSFKQADSAHIFAESTPASLFPPSPPLPESARMDIWPACGTAILDMETLEFMPWQDRVYGGCSAVQFRPCGDPHAAECAGELPDGVVALEAEAGVAGGRNRHRENSPSERPPADAGVK